MGQGRWVGQGEVGGAGGGGWAYPKGTKSMAVSKLGGRKGLVGIG